MVQDQIELHVSHRLKDFNPVCYLVKFVTNATQHVHFRNSNGALWLPDSSSITASNQRQPAPQGITDVREVSV